MRSTPTTSPPFEESLYFRQHPSAGSSRFTVADCSKGTSLDNLTSPQPTVHQQPNSLPSDFSGYLLPSPSYRAPTSVGPTTDTSNSMSSSLRSLATSVSASEENPGASFLNSPYNTSASSSSSTSSLDAKTALATTTPKPKVTATTRVIDKDPAASAAARREQKKREEEEQKAEEAGLVEIPLWDDDDEGNREGEGDEASWVKVNANAKAEPAARNKTLAELGWVKVPKKS